MKGSAGSASVVTDTQLDRYLMGQFRRSSAAWLLIGTVGLPIFGIVLWNVATERRRLLVWLGLMVLAQLIIIIVTAVVQPRVSLLKVGLPAAVCGSLWGLLTHIAMPASVVGQGHVAISFAFILPCCVMAMSTVRVPAFLYVTSFGIVWLVGWIRNAADAWDPVTPALLAIFGVALVSIEMLWRMHCRSAINAITARLESETDPLTGLLNRQAFFVKADRELQKGSDAVLLLVDLDAFKLIIDLFGNDVGDQLFGAAARRIRNAAPDRALIGRVGGDEIAVFMPNSGPNDLRIICDAIVEGFEAIFALENESVSVDVSIGAVQAEPICEIAELLRRAHQAMLKAKRQGERVMVYSRELSDELASAVHTRASLTRSIDDGDFVAYLQPVVDVRNDQVLGFEALARWQTNEGIVPASEFLAAAAAADLLPSITRLVAADVVRFIERLDDKTQSRLMFGINVDLADLGPMLDWLETAVSDPSRLIVEVTEQDDTVDVLTPELLASKLDSGIQVVLDDFGVAFSSFGRVLELPVSGLKVDASFVKDMLTSPTSRAVINAIASVAQEMGLSVIAEGVETTAQSAALADLGIYMQQGYLHSHPLSVDHAFDLVDSMTS